MAVAGSRGEEGCDLALGRVGGGACELTLDSGIRHGERYERESNRSEAGEMCEKRRRISPPLGLSV